MVGVLSGSSTSVTGPAAGLTAVVASQIAELGSFQAFLVALIVAGALQIVFGLLKGGFLASFFPSSVVKGLLAAIGIIIILKQLPHLVGYDANPVGDTDFCQTDQKNTFTELPTAFKMFSSRCDNDRPSFVRPARSLGKSFMATEIPDPWALGGGVIWNCSESCPDSNGSSLGHSSHSLGSGARRRGSLGFSCSCFPFPIFPHWPNPLCTELQLP